MENLPENFTKLVYQLEDDILAEIARLITAFDLYLPSADYEVKRLEAMGLTKKYIIARVAKFAKRSEKEITTIFQQAGKEALAADDAIYKLAGLTPLPINEDVALLAILNSGIKKTKGEFKNMVNSADAAGSKQFGQVLDQAYMRVVSGAFDAETAIRHGVKELAKQGVTAYEYPKSRRRDSIETVVRRAVLSGVNQTALELQWARADEQGCDLVEVDAHAGARTGVGVANHAGWQGKIYSRSGKSTKYPSFAECTGYGTGEGLGGYNCLHSFHPFYEGLSKPIYTQAMLADMESPKYSYDGKLLTEAEVKAEQRKIERNIRNYQRQYKAAKDASSLAKAREWRAREKSFIQQTGFKKQYGRTFVA